jgi:hypothetical protein
VFSHAQYEAVIRELDDGTRTLQSMLAEVKPAARRATGHWWVDPLAAKAINWIADQTVEIGTAMFNWIIDVLKGATAPIWMFIDSYRWMEVRGAANEIAADLSTQNLVVDDTDWSGTAHRAYLGAAGAQAAAATRMASIATTTSTTLAACAAAGLAFYIVVAGVLAKLIAATAAAIAAFGSAVFSWAGAAIIIEEAGVNTAVLAGAAAALTAFLGAQAGAMIALHGEAEDPGGFPNRAWPTSNSEQFNDATVYDKDTRPDADWSLKEG